MNTNPTTEPLMDLRERMVRIETKLDTFAEHRVADRTDIDDHETRIGVLETRSKIMAAIGAVGLGIATFFQGPITALLG